MRGQSEYTTRPHARLTPSFMDMDTWITSKLNEDFIIIRSLNVLGSFFDILSMGLVQPGTGRRPVNMYRNEMSVLYVLFCYVLFCYPAPNILSGHSSPFSLHLSHQDSVSRDRRIRWCHLSTIPGTTPHRMEMQILRD